MDKKQVCIAVITTAHGIHGSVKIKNFMESIDTLRAFKSFYTNDGREFTVKSIKLHKEDIVIASFEKIKDRNAAEALRGTKLYIPRESLPALESDEVYYHTDLMHLNVHLTTGKKIGVVSSVLNYGAGDILEIQLKNAEIVCVPFRKRAVPTVNLEGGFLIIDADLSFTDEDLKKVLESCGNLGKQKS